MEFLDGICFFLNLFFGFICFCIFSLGFYFFPGLMVLFKGFQRVLLKKWFGFFFLK